MQLEKQAREWWPRSLTATDVAGSPMAVDATGYEASVDGGLTWVPSRDNAGRPGWLVAGPDFPGPGDDGQLPVDLRVMADVAPKIRIRDIPETTIVTCPPIYVVE